MEKERVYFVIDMKSFFASVECSLLGLDAMTTNLVVADKERSSTTICLAVSPSLKSLGVKNRCRLYEIPKDIDFIIASPKMKKYIEFAAKIYEIYLNYFSKDDIQVYSIDECFLDVTDYLKIYKTKAKPFAKKLMKEILDKTGIPSSCGIGTNLYLAKIALDISAKHSEDRIGWLDEEKFKKTLWTHTPITDFWGISKGISERLKKYNIKTMKDICFCPENVLYDEFGVNAELLIDHAFGKETCLMEDIKSYKAQTKSRSQSQILKENYSYLDALIVLKEMICHGAYNLLRDHLVTDSVGLMIGYGDKKGEESKGKKRLNINTNIDYILEEEAVKLFEKIVDRSRPIRKITYYFGEVYPEEQEFYDLLVDKEKIDKNKKKMKVINSLNDKFGKNTILKGISYSEKATMKERNQMIGGHKSGEAENE